jgi:hypothetical protein
MSNNLSGVVAGGSLQEKKMFKLFKIISPFTSGNQNIHPPSTRY